MNDGQITTHIKEHLLLIGIDNQPKKNALSSNIMRELSIAIAEYDANDELRCAVLYGHGDAYCAGFDLGQLKKSILSDELIYDDPEGPIDPFGVSGRHLSKPLVVAAHRFCFAGGVEVALAGDIIIAAEGTLFGQPEVQRGIFTFGGGAARWLNRVRWGNTQRYLLTGDALDAEEALRIGLVQEVVEPEKVLERAVEIATKIASAAPLGVKHSLAVSRLAYYEGSKAAYASLPERQKESVQTQDAEEGVKSFLEKRAGEYIGR